MKELKAYLKNQKDLAMTLWANELGKGKETNLAMTAYWNDRIIHLDQMIKDLENGK